MISFKALNKAAPPGKRPRLAELRRTLNPWQRYEPPKDRVNEIRWNAIKKRHPKLLDELNRKLVNHPDLHWVRIYLRETRFDSYLEMLFSLRLLADGGRPGWVSPQGAGFDLHPIIDPETRRISGHLLHPAIAWKGQLLIPQLTMTGRLSNWRPDILVGSRFRGGIDWRLIEIDGLGHDHHNDREKEQALGLLVTRFKTDRVVDGSFLHEIIGNQPAAA